MKVLVPLDGSRFAEAVLPVVSQMAQSGDFQVTLVTVITSAHPTLFRAESSDTVEDVKGQWDVFSGRIMLPSPKGRAVLVESATQAVERSRVEAKEYLEGIAHRHFPKGAETVVLTSPHVAMELLRYAVDHPCDLIAMATHGHTGLARLVLGSVAAQVLQARVLPVLMVRPARLRD